MKRELLEVYVCPVNHSRLSIAGTAADEVIDGELMSTTGSRYIVSQGVPQFLPSALLTREEQETQAEYDATAEQKDDAAVDWLFRSFYESEDDVRERMVDLLRLAPGSRVLEIGSGTGRDSFRIARKLDAEGELFVQDLSEQMVRKTRDRLASESKKLGLLPKIATLFPLRDFCHSPTASLMPSFILAASTISANPGRHSQKWRGL